MSVMKINTSSNKKLTVENVIIIGGGPAGLSAAIYLARANLKPLVFAGSPPGGQLMLTSEVENYPGYESILGAELITKMRNQAIKLGAKIIDENIKEMKINKSEFQNSKSETNPNIQNSNDQNRLENSNLKNLKIVSSFEIRALDLYLTKSVIIATGAKALWLGVPGEERLRGKGVSACATCDGFFFRGKTVAVIGGGDTALEEALTLTKFAVKVYLIHRRDRFKASKIMVERVLKHPKIEVIWNAQIAEIIGENHIEAIKLQVNSPEILSRLNSSLLLVKQKVAQKFGSLTNKNQIIFPIEGIFVAIGHKPDTNLFNGQIELDEKGYIITSIKAAIEQAKFQILNSKSQINLKSKNKTSKQNHLKHLNLENSNLFGISDFDIRIYDLSYQSSTSVPGVFAAGDCVDSVYRQASTAMGMGVAAALDVERWLEE